MYSSTGQADFSSVLMRSASADQVSAMQMLDEEAVRPAVNDFSRDFNQDRVISENRNLSSVITQIRDQGSALPETKKVLRWNRKDAQEKAAAVAGKQVPGQAARPVSKSVEKAQTAPANHSESLPEIDMPAFEDADKTNPSTKRGRWQPLVLVLAIAVSAVMAFSLYQLNGRANELNVALSAYEERIDELDTVQSESAGTLLQLSKLNQELSGLKQELNSIKSDREASDSRRAQSDRDADAPQQKEIATVRQNVSELESGLSSTRNELSVIKAAIAEVRGALAAGKESVKQTGDTEAVKPAGGWAVNLASLSSREQARVGVAMLKHSGRVPVVQEAVVNGEKVYRLSVEGFATRNEATQFIHRASTQYGFDGGWVRQL